MNKLVACLTLVVLLGCATAASAQVNFGVKGGVNFGNMSFSVAGNGILHGNYRTAAVAGVFVELPVAPHIVIQPEGLFDMKGMTASSGTFGVTGVTGTGTVRATYFDVPVLVRFDVPTTGKVAAFLYAGPQVGFLLSATATATGEPDENIKSDMRGTEFTMAFGGGVHFGRASIEARYVQGLTNVLTDTASDNGTVSVKNRTIKVLFGVKF